MRQDRVSRGPARERSEPVVLDTFDRQILALLAADARLSIRAISRRIGRSAGAVGERLARLEGNRIITGYYADIDYTQLGLMRTLLGVRVVDDALLDSCIEAITALDEVKRVWVVTGTWSAVAEAYVHDAAHLRDLLQVRMRAIDGVQHTEAMLVLETTEAVGSTSPLAESVPLLTSPDGWTSAGTRGLEEVTSCTEARDGRPDRPRPGGDRSGPSSGRGPAR